MASKFSAQLFLPVFGGQGISHLDPCNSRVDLASLSPFGITLLSACHTAFLSELASLDAERRTIVDICASQFAEKEFILWPQNDLVFDNPAFSGSHLLLTQVLRYLSFVEKFAAASVPIPFTDVLRSNAHHGVGILGFSSGIISACVVASSSSILSFINHAVEAYRLAFWIGIRSQIYRAALLSTGDVAPHPWAIMLLGIMRDELLRSIEHFNEFGGKDRIVLTSVLGDGRYTVSGHPHDLILFVRTLPNGVASHVTAINALYHCSSFLRGVRDEVLRDVISRHVRFPGFLDILAPIRSTLSGSLISNTTSSGSLVELVIDMVLMHPVNWDFVLHQTVSTLPPHITVNLIDLGLGSSLVRGFEASVCRNGAVRKFEVVYPQQDSVPKYKTKQEPIAIIGMAVNMPGAPTASKLWDVIANGLNTVEKIPENRFTFEDCVAGRSLRAQTGNFIHDVDQFDNRFFNISPREARSMDPQQRILLQVAYEALEDAGYVPHGSPTFDPATIGCYIGAATHDYIQNLRNDIDVYYSTGTLKAFISGRLSYCLGLSGPSIVIDTACSSSMVAIHQASRALMNRDCHAALAGGVNVISSPDMFIGLDRGHFLNSSGQCKPFDATADGYSRGEGCGIFVLKRLTDAVSENDQILGIIRGVEVNQSGKALSITHPHAPTQEDLFNQLLMNSDVDFNSVNVVEAHGTGTQAGDTAEMESIRRLLLADDRAPDNPLYITSIKANIGHLEAASGCASLAKILLMLRHEIIPHQISLSALNPRITRLTSDNYIITTRNVTWMPPKSKTPRMALINNFGAAGSNAALLLQEYIAQKSPLPITNISSYVFGFSAKDKDSLEALRSKYLAWLQRPSTRQISIMDIAYTSTARRQVYPYRLATSAGSVQQLVQKLEKESIVHVPRDEVGSEVIFVFSGQGHKSHEMAGSLYKTSAVFRRHIDECNSVLISNGFTPIISVIAGTGYDRHLVPAVQEVEVTQTATFALQYALSKLWITWGIMPVAAVGHRSVFRLDLVGFDTKTAKCSLGEYVALVTAGVLQLEDAILIVATRARMVLERCLPAVTGMVAVSLEPMKLQHILDSNQSFANTSIACYNSPQDCVVSGPLHELEDFISFLKKEGSGKFTQLNIPYGYHSPLMSHLTDDLMVLSGKTLVFPPCIPFISTVLGRVIMPGDRSFPSQDYFARQCVEPVKFTEAIGSYLSNTQVSGKHVWLEISAHPSILPMLRSFPALSDSLLLGSLRACEDSWTSLSKSLTSFYRTGDESVHWRSVFSEVGPAKCIGLPSYSFNKRRFWVPYVAGKVEEVVTAQGAHSSLINQWVQFPGGGDDKVAIFQTPIDQFKHFIKGHRVGGVPLCPASVYLELIFGAIGLTAGYTLQHVEDSETVLCQLSFPKPLIMNHADTGDTSMITIIVNISEKTFVLKSRVSLLESDAIHARGEYYLRPIVAVQQESVGLTESIHGHINAILGSEKYQTPEIFSARTIYQVIFPRVVEYSAMFHTLRTLSMPAGGMDATGSMVLSSFQENELFVARTLFLDTLVHIAGFLCNLRASQNDAYICNQVGSIQILTAAIQNNSSFTIYCKISPSRVEKEDALIGETYVISDSRPTILIAYCKNIRFQRVRLSGLKLGLASKAGVRSSSLDRPPLQNESNSSLASNVMAAVVNIVANTCGILSGDVSVDMGLEGLGVDSLMRIEMSYDLSKAFPEFRCRSQELGTCRTIADVIETVLSVITPTSSFESPRENSVSLSLSTFPTPRTLVRSGSRSPSMRQLIARILDIKEDSIEGVTQLSSLGLDSLASIEVAHALRQEYQINLPGSFFSSSRTILDLENQILELDPAFSPSILTGHLPLTGTKQNRFLVSSQCRHTTLSILQNSHSERVPLVLIHDGTGLTISYKRLSKLNRQVWAIRNPRSLSSEPWSTLEEMAESYAQLILKEMEGSIILGGWSFGGVVALEIARQLRTRSVDVLGLVLIDSPSPFVHVPLSPALIDKVLDNLEPESQEFCKIQLLTNSQLLSKYSPRDVVHTQPLIFLMSEKPYTIPGDVDIPPWLSDRRSKSSIIAGWEIFSGGPFDTFHIPGHHFEAFDPQNVEVVSNRISQACEEFDKNYYNLDA